MDFSFRSLPPTEHLPESNGILPRRTLRSIVTLEATKERTRETSKPDTEKQIKLNIHDHPESFYL